MANKTVIVVKKPGELINKAYIERVCKECTTYWGAALIHDKKLVINHERVRPSVDAVMALQGAPELKDTQVVLVFGENKDILVEDMLPFDVLADKNSDTHVAVFMDGNFKGYEVPKSTHTHEWHCKEDFLKSKMQKLFKIANMDKTVGLPEYGAAALFEEFEDPSTQQDFSNSWTDRGFMTLLTTAGGAVIICNKGNAFKADYNWGTVSQSLNYLEQTVAKPEPKAEEVKPPSLLDKLLGKKEAATTAAKPVDLPAEKATSTAILAAAEEEYETVGPAPEHLHNRQKVEWWMKEVGYKPNGFKDKTCRVKRIKGTKVGLLAPLAATNVVADAATHINTEHANDVVAKALTNDEVKTLPEKAEPTLVKDVTPTHVSVENMPIMSPKQKLILKNGWMKDAEVLKLLGDDHKALAYDPKKLQELEDKYATFYDGLGLDGTLWLSFEALMKLGEVDVKALAQYAFNRQNDNAKTTIQLKSIIADPNNKIAAPKRVAL